MRVVGIDGCRGGWLAAVVDDARVSWRWTAAIADVLSEPADAVAVDMPIGLVEAGRRACDVEARRLLGRQASSVFAAPVRAVLGCATYADARALLADRGGASMSAQAFGIVRAVRDLDAALSPDDDDRVVEAHPELAFRAMTGTMLAGKKTKEGREQRLTALAKTWPDALALLAAAPKPAAPDDALDALACAWVANRWVKGQATVLGNEERDARGRPMRIAY